MPMPRAYSETIPLSTLSQEVGDLCADSPIIRNRAHVRWISTTEGQGRCTVVADAFHQCNHQLHARCGRHASAAIPLTRVEHLVPGHVLFFRGPVQGLQQCESCANGVPSTSPQFNDPASGNGSLAAHIATANAIASAFASPFNVSSATASATHASAITVSATNASAINTSATITSATNTSAANAPTIAADISMTMGPVATHAGPASGHDTVTSGANVAPERELNISPQDDPRSEVEDAVID